ncbi:hypothetical protein [Burkholderia ubonensis]|nr:hypothetical protein [Burkholderia ubonensis]
MKARRWLGVLLLALLTVPTLAQACDYGSGGGSSSSNSGSQGKGGGY